MEQNSFWRSTYEEDLQEAEDQVVLLSGISPDSFSSYKVDLDLKAEGEGEGEGEEVIPLYVWTYK